MIEQLLAPLHPDERALSALFQANIDEDMLREIAEADYGEGADECYPLLQQIVRSGVAASDHFQLREVLNLTRLAPPSGMRGSWMQVFTCTALLQLTSQDLESYLADCENLAPFVSSAIDLGEPVARAAASVLAWRVLSAPGYGEDSAFLGFAILQLAVHVERREDRGPWLKQLATWVGEEESRARSLLKGRSTPDWLLGLTHVSLYEGLWRYLARRTLVEPSSPHPREADGALRRLGELLVEPR